MIFEQSCSSSADGGEGGDPSEADQLLSALEETLLQAARTDAVLRPDQQGEALHGRSAVSRLYPCAEWISVCLQSIIFDEVDLTDASVAESSTKNVNNSFTVSLSTSAAESSPCRLCGSEYSGVLTAAPSAGLMLFSFQCPLRVG